MVDDDEPATDGSRGSGDDVNIPLSDDPLLDLLDALVNDRGKVAAAEALGENLRTIVVWPVLRPSCSVMVASERPRRWNSTREHRPSVPGDIVAARR